MLETARPSLVLHIEVEDPAPAYVQIARKLRMALAAGRYSQVIAFRASAGSRSS